MRCRLSLWRVVCGALAVALVGTGARAACMFPAPFGQLDPSCSNGSYCYVVNPNSSPQSLDGAFWAFGFGAPSTGAGADDGTASLATWLPLADGGRYLQGDWIAGGVDGCVTGHVAPGKPAEIMVAEIEDVGPIDAYGSGGRFAIAAARRFSGDYPEYDFTFAAGGGPSRNIALVGIPRARVLESTRTTLLFGSPEVSAVSAGVFTDGSVSAGELAAGYRVFHWTATTDPASYRKTAGWEAVTPTIPFGQDVTVTHNSLYRASFAYGLVFDSGFETVYVGPYITSTSYCNPTDADGDGVIDAYGDPECCPFPAACDCDDHNPLVHPGAVELCNGIDDDCDGIVDNVTPLGAIESVNLSKVTGATRVLWTASTGAATYDVIRGDLALLQSTRGSFSASTIRCVASDVAGTTVDDPDDSGESRWYLIRPRNCLGPGTYDTADATQAAPRDAGIQASGQGCP